ncbi:hypothetical protein ACOSQ2_014493 [Xanthoceras sorbifolium]
MGMYRGPSIPSLTDSSSIPSKKFRAESSSLETRPVLLLQLTPTQWQQLSPTQEERCGDAGESRKVLRARGRRGKRGWCGRRKKICFWVIRAPNELDGN